MRYIATKRCRRHAPFWLLGLYLLAPTLSFAETDGGADAGENSGVVPTKDQDTPKPVIEAASDPTYKIGMMLRCPVCQGMPVAESPSSMAQSMMNVVRDLHKEGKSEEEILDYFVKRYGEWVLLRPRAKGLGVFVWVLPPVLLLLGVWACLSWLRSHRVTATDAAKPATVAQSDDPTTTDDQLVRRLRDEV